MSRRPIDTNLAELLTELKLGDKSDIMMLDFEKTTPKYSGMAGVVMDAGWNVLDVRSAMNSEGEVRSQFIDDITSKIVYETLINPRFHREWDNVQRVKRKANRKVYGFYKELKSEDWFSDKTPRVEIDYHFANFMYREASEEMRILSEKIVEIFGKMQYWGDYNPRTPSSAADRDKHLRNRQEDYARGMGSYITLEELLGTEEDFLQKLESDEFLSGDKWEYVQRKYMDYVYTSEKAKIQEQATDAQIAKSSVEVSWEKDKQRFAQLNTPAEIEPWRMIMEELMSNLERRASAGTLLGISAYGIHTSEFSNIKTTSSYLGAPDYSKAIREYEHVCMMNMTAILDNAKGEEVLDFIGSRDRETVKQGFEELISKQAIKKNQKSFELRFQTLIDPNYKQKHTGVQDAYDHSELLVEVVRKQIVPILEDGEW